MADISDPEEKQQSPSLEVVGQTDTHDVNPQAASEHIVYSIEQDETFGGRVDTYDLPIDEREEISQNGEQQEEENSDREEKRQRKSRLEERTKLVDDISSKQQASIDQRATERLEQSSKHSILFRRIDPNHLRNVGQLFVEPEGYQEFVQRVLSSSRNHILIVAGQEDNGKFMAALYVAQQVWQKEISSDEVPDIYLFADHSDRNLLEVVSDENLPQNAMLLFEEVFDKKQINHEWLTHRYIDLNDDLIARKNVWFIFTVLQGPYLESLQTKGLPILHMQKVNRRLVLAKLIDFFFSEQISSEDQRKQLLEAQANFNPYLTPADLSLLFQTKRNDFEGLLKILKSQEPLKENITPDKWFQSLEPMNYQLYALLVVLFDKLDLPTLEEIYVEAVNVLRRQGMDGPNEFIDPRRIGTNMMHDKLDLQVRLNNALGFRKRIYRQYVEEQIKNYQHLLWSLIDPDDPSTFTGLVGLIHGLSKYDDQLANLNRDKENRRVASDQLWQLRYAIASMIAQVGVYHLPKLRQLLEKLVNDESPLVSVTVALVLAEIARWGRHFDFIEALLHAWCDSGRFELMWAAASSISTIYEAIARRLDENVEVLIWQEKEEEEQNTDASEQKSQGKKQLARLRELFTTLIERHKSFSTDVIENEQRLRYTIYRAQLRQRLEANSMPLPNTEHLFRELSEVEQEHYLNTLYTENKQAIDDAIKRDHSLLVTSWGNQMRMVLVQALGNIAQLWPRDITRLIRVWLDRKDLESPLWQIGHMALNYLFQESARIKDASRLEQAAYPLLYLFPLAMRTHKMTVEAFMHDIDLFMQMEALQETGMLGQHIEVGELLNGDSLIYVLYSVQRWYENLSLLEDRQNHKQGQTTNEDEDEDKEQSETQESAYQRRWRQVVYTVLADAMNSAPQEERHRLRWALFLWIRSDQQMPSHIARTLISHSYVMDGIVLDLPTSKRTGIVVIDGFRREREDRERIFYLLQKLSAIVPLRLHWLGYARSSRLLSGEEHKEGTRGGEEERRLILGPDDLQLKGAERPSLLMPLLTSKQGGVIPPESIYFIAIFHSEEILDLDDLYPEASNAAKDESKNIFWQHRKGITQARKQPWRDKVYLLPSSEQVKLPPYLAHLATVIYPDAFGLVEEQLRQQVPHLLRNCTAAELWYDLQAYMGIPNFAPRTFSRLADEIEHWLAQLADTNTLYPDVSLFILWTILARSREQFTEALQLVAMLLGEERAEEEMDKAAKKTRKLRQQMGIACTRMLFSLYGTDNPTLPIEPYGALLDVLPLVMACATSYTELLPILAVLFQLARNPDWFYLLNEEEGKFFECIGMIAPKESLPLRNWLRYDQYLIEVSRLFIEYNQPLTEFRASGVKILRRYKSPQPKKKAIRDVFSPNGIESKFLAILPTSNGQEEQNRYSWALQQIALQESRFLNRETQATTLAEFKNQETLLSHLLSELQARQDGTIEGLKQGEFYGVLMVEAQSDEAVRQAFQFLQLFVKIRKESKRQQITLMVQRLGEKEVLAKVRNSRKLRSEREIRDKRKRPLLIGPLLERYPVDQVAFVLIMTVDPVIDYDDWAEQDQWARRLWVARLGAWHPYRGEIVTGDGMQLMLETVLNETH